MKYSYNLNNSYNLHNAYFNPIQDGLFRVESGAGGGSEGVGSQKAPTPSIKSVTHVLH